MRLIDADMLLKRFSYGEAESETDAAWIAAVRKIIREQPTAYDVGEVVERLSNPNNYTVVAGKHFTTVERAVEIVKAGGAAP